jgi:hypothetical protein
MQFGVLEFYHGVRSRYNKKTNDLNIGITTGIYRSVESSGIVIIGVLIGVTMLTELLMINE